MDFPDHSVAVEIFSNCRGGVGGCWLVKLQTFTFNNFKSIFQLQGKAVKLY